MEALLLRTCDFDTLKELIQLGYRGIDKDAYAFCNDHHNDIVEINGNAIKLEATPILFGNAIITYSTPHFGVCYELDSVAIGRRIDCGDNKELFIRLAAQQSKDESRHLYRVKETIKIDGKVFDENEILFGKPENKELLAKSRKLRTDEIIHIFGYGRTLYLKNRYNNHHELIQYSKDLYRCNFYNNSCGITNDGDNILAIDPEGGPYIAVGTTITTINNKSYKVQELTCKEDGLFLRLCQI